MGRKKEKSKEVVHFDCIPCRRCIRSRRQWMEHLEGKIHVNGVIDYALKYGISTEKASELAFETIVPMSEDEVVIAAFRCKGISIPLDVKNVENVQRNKRPETFIGSTVSRGQTKLYTCGGRQGLWNHII